MPASAVDGRSDPAYLVRRTSDPDEAQSFVAHTYLPNKLVLLSGDVDVDMELTALRLGSLTAGRLTFGRYASVSTSHSTNFRVNIPLRGRAVTRSGQDPPVHTVPGEAAVIRPEASTEVLWSADCAQLVLMISRESLESELETLLGRSLATPLNFDAHMPTSGPVRGLWRSALDMICAELAAPSDLAIHASAGLHARGLLLDGLLLWHHHNYSELVERRATPGPPTAIGRALELLHSQPGKAWTVVGLAAEVHLSVRALQEGFARDVQVPPMTYLRRLRLRRARDELQASDPSQTTVRAVATRLGIVHPGRFAATYKATYGESPSETLAGSRPDQAPPCERDALEVIDDAERPADSADHRGPAEPSRG